MKNHDQAHPQTLFGNLMLIMGSKTFSSVEGLSEQDEIDTVFAGFILIQDKFCEPISLLIFPI